MKKLVLAAMISAFSLSAAAAYACDGMKTQENTDTSQSQAKAQAQGKKNEKKQETAKSDQKS